MPKPGKFAHIYRNPLMREGDEGWAMLKEKKSEDRYFEFWLVEFPDSGEQAIKRLAKFDYRL